MIPRQYHQTDALIQWAYFLEDVKPLQTSTCALFWRSVVLTPIKVLGPLLIVTFLGIKVGKRPGESSKISFPISSRTIEIEAPARSKARLFNSQRTNGT